MKKIFSLVALTGMLMSFSMFSGEILSCWDGAERAAYDTLREGGSYEEANERFADYFEVCSGHPLVVVDSN